MRNAARHKTLSNNYKRPKFGILDFLDETLSGGNFKKSFPFGAFPAWALTFKLQNFFPSWSWALLVSQASPIYRARNKCLYVVGRTSLLLLLNCSVWPSLSPDILQTSISGSVINCLD